MQSIRILRISKMHLKEVNFAIKRGEGKGLKNLGVFVCPEYIWFKTTHDSKEGITGPANFPFLAEVIIDLGESRLIKNRDGDLTEKEYLTYVGKVPPVVLQMPQCYEE